MNVLHLPSLLLEQATSAPTVQQAPVFVWTPVAVLTWITASLSLLVSITSLVLTLRQKSRELKLGFYTTHVVTPAIAAIIELTDDYRDKFVASIQPAASVRKTVPRTSTKLLEEFSGKLYALNDALNSLVGVFDSKAANKIRLSVDGFDTEIAGWLFSVNGSKEPDALKEMFLDFKRELIKIIYYANFELDK